MARPTRNFAFCLGITLSLTIISQLEANINPGIKVKINPPCLVLGKNLAVKEITKKINSARIPNQSGKGYQLTKIRLTSFSPGQTTFKTKSPNVFVVDIRGASVSARANFSAEKKLLFFTIRDSGSIMASASGISIKQSISIYRNTAGKPTMIPGSCTTSISKFRPKINGGLISWLVNIFLKLFRNTIRRKVEREICPLIRRELTKQGNRITRKFNVNFPLIDDIFIDMGLVRNPVAGTNTFMASLKGRCYKRGHQSQMFLYNPSPIPMFSLPQKCAHFQVSEYTLNALLYSMWKCNRFSITISPQKISKTVGFNVTAGTLTGFIPKFANFPKNSQLELVFNATSAPITYITSNEIRVECQFSKVVNAFLTNGQKEEALNCDVSMAIRMKVSLKKGIVSGSVTNITVAALSCDQFPFDEFIEIVNEFLPSQILPAINEVAKAGFKVPDLYGFKSSGLAIAVKQKAIEVGANFN